MRLLLVEDDTHIADFVIKGFSEASFQVIHVANGMDGLAVALTDEFDAAIVDIMLPELDGIKLIKTLRNRNIHMPVLIISARQRVEERVRGLEAGGDDFLVKPFAFTELHARIKALIRRAKGHGERSLFRMENLSIDLLSREVWRDGTPIELQPREFDLLAYLFRNAGRVVTKTMIIENVWHFNFDPHTNIVEARISKLREKVDRDFEPKLIQTIRGAGYVLRNKP